MPGLASTSNVAYSGWRYARVFGNSFGTVNRRQKTFLKAIGGRSRQSSQALNGTNRKWTRYDQGSLCYARPRLLVLARPRLLPS
jgi:hypothetical protein